MTTEGEKIVEEVYIAFEEWRVKNDPDGELELMEAIRLYSNWCADQEKRK